MTTGVPSPVIIDINLFRGPMQSNATADNRAATWGTRLPLRDLALGRMAMRFLRS
jgi:hypothetical protein